MCSSGGAVDTGELMSTEHDALKSQFGPLFDEVSAALFAADPLGINSGGNTTAYDPDAAAIVPRLGKAHDADDVQVIVHEEFCRRFSSERAGAVGRYEEVSAIIWDAWLRLAPVLSRGS
jgi:hypothetical protein